MSQVHRRCKKGEKCKETGKRKRTREEKTFAWGYFLVGAGGSAARGYKGHKQREKQWCISVCLGRESLEHSFKIYWHLRGPSLPVIPPVCASRCISPWQYGRLGFRRSRRWAGNQKINLFHAKTKRSGSKRGKQAVHTEVAQNKRRGGKKTQTEGRNKWKWRKPVREGTIGAEGMGGLMG